MLQGIPTLMATAFAARYLLNNYLGASVGYSLRKINANATYAIKVRRSSDNAEQDIGFTSTGDLDEASLTAFVGANDGFVKTWYDQSVNGNNATQTTNASQPKIINAGTIYRRNEKASIHFSGAQSLTLTTALSGTSGFTNFTVYAKDSFTDTVQGICGPVGPSISLWNSDGYIYSADGFSGGSYVSYYNYTGEAMGIRLVTAYTDTIVRNNWANNVALNQSGAAPQTAGNLDSIGSGTIGDVLEIIHYATNQTSNRVSIEGNMNSYYNVF